jgi:elongation factor G
LAEAMLYESGITFPYQTGTIYSFCISAKLNMGAGRIMGFIDNVCPSAYEMSPQRTIDNCEIPCTDKVKTAIFIYKTRVKPHECYSIKSFDGRRNGCLRSFHQNKSPNSNS